jgi:hypothetical protein
MKTRTKIIIGILIGLVNGGVCYATKGFSSRGGVVYSNLPVRGQLVPAVVFFRLIGNVPQRKEVKINRGFDTNNEVVSDNLIEGDVLVLNPPLQPYTGRTTTKLE